MTERDAQTESFPLPSDVAESLADLLVAMLEGQREEDVETGDIEASSGS